MNYFKYAGLFFVIFFVLGSIGVAVAGVIGIAISLCISVAIVTNKIIKSNNRVMTFIEVIKYTLCFAVVATIVPAILFSIALFVRDGVLFDNNIMFMYLFIVALPMAFVSMFVTNVYSKSRYEDGYSDALILREKVSMSYLKYTSLFFLIFVAVCGVCFFATESVIASGGGINNPIAILPICATIAWVVTATIVANNIIKTKSRIMTFLEIVKYALCFVMVATLFSWVIIMFKPTIVSFALIIGALLLALIQMFLVNVYFKNRYKRDN